MSANDRLEARLRRRLAEVADSTRLAPDAWERVEARVRRRRVPGVALGVAAAVVVAVIAVAAAVLVGDGGEDGPSIAATGDRLATCGAAPPADVEVTLDPDATAPQREAVEQILAESSAVSDYSFQSQEEGARIYECVYADDPGRLEGRDLDRIPSMFFVTLVPGADGGALVRDLEAAAGVLDVSRARRCSERADLEVFMVVATLPEEITAVRSALENASEVARFVFVSKEDAHEEFACVFADKPDLVRETSPAALPPSFRVTLVSGADHTRLSDQLALLPGVDAVVDTRYPIAEPVPDFHSETLMGSPPAG